MSHLLAVIFLMLGRCWVAGGDGGDTAAAVLLAAPGLSAQRVCASHERSWHGL